jgi:hypothetical protein
MRLFFDESGFTGEDLANSAQPIFVLASTRADNSFSAETYRRIFAQAQSPELKHSSLARTAIGRRRVLDFLGAVRGSGLFAIWVVHKEFCLLSKLVDLWLEPALRDHGIDFYERGANLGFCNMAWFCLRTFESPAFLTRHLCAFQDMLRTRTRRSYKTFWQGMSSDARRSRSETKEILDYFLYSASQLGFDHLLELPDRTLEICLTSALQTVGHWRGQTVDDFEIVHDNSSNMAREKWIWDAMTSHEMPEFRVGPAEFAVEYPLRVTGTTFADSSHHLQLQFADIMAGAMVAWSRSLINGATQSEYSAALKEAGIAEHLIGGIWPAPDVEPIPQAPGSIGANQYIDLAARVLHKARKSQDPTA